MDFEGENQSIFEDQNSPGKTDENHEKE